MRKIIRNRMIGLCLILAMLCGALMMTGCWRASACGLHPFDTGVWASDDGNIVLTILPYEERWKYPCLIWGYVRCDNGWQEMMVLYGIGHLSFFDAASVYQRMANTKYGLPADNEWKRLLDLSVTSFPSKTVHTYSVVTSDGFGYRPDDRITFRRNEQAQPQYVPPYDWMKKNDRPVDLYDSILKTDAGDCVLQIGRAPLLFGSEIVNGERLDFFLIETTENGVSLLRAYPMSAIALIGTDELAAATIGFWTWKKPAMPADELLHGFMDEFTHLKTVLFDPDADINVFADSDTPYPYGKSGYRFYKLPCTEWENSDRTRTLRVGDPATMTGTMTINGESVAVTWVMENYYHSDIVRVYRTVDYESEGFSSEDDLLCRMKVRCTDERQDTFVATVVGEGVFPDGTCFTYHMEN